MNHISTYQSPKGGMVCEEIVGNRGGWKQEIGKPETRVDTCAVLTMNPPRRDLIGKYHMRRTLGMSLNGLPRRP